MNLLKPIKIPTETLLKSVAYRPPGGLILNARNPRAISNIPEGTLGLLAEGFV